MYGPSDTGHVDRQTSTFLRSRRSIIVENRRVNDSQWSNSMLCLCVFAQRENATSAGSPSQPSPWVPDHVRNVSRYVLTVPYLRARLSAGYGNSATTNASAAVMLWAANSLIERVRRVCARRHDRIRRACAWGRDLTFHGRGHVVERPAFLEFLAIFSKKGA